MIPLPPDIPMRSASDRLAGTCQLELLDDRLDIGRVRRILTAKPVPGWTYIAETSKPSVKRVLERRGFREANRRGDKSVYCLKAR